MTISQHELTRTTLAVAYMLTEAWVRQDQIEGESSSEPTQ